MLFGIGRVVFAAYLSIELSLLSIKARLDRRMGCCPPLDQSDVVIAWPAFRMFIDWQQYYYILERNLLASCFVGKDKQ